MATSAAKPPQAPQGGPPASLAPCEYKTGRTLGQGSYATVKEAVHIKTGKRYAVKVISKQLMRGKETMILNEIEVLKKISKGHGNIVTLWDYFETPNNLYLVMDLCNGGELFDRICEKGSYYEEDAADIIRTVCDVIRYLHSQNIVHRDIKAENLLFRSRETSDPADLMIADFGLSKMMNDEKHYMLMTTCGTPGYMAPEVIKRVGHSKPVDMWSLGVLTYFLLCGYTPFDASTQAEEIQNILKGRFAFEPKEYWEDVSEEAKDFIKKLLVVSPQQRLTPEQALAHPWLTKQDEVPNILSPMTPSTPVDLAMIKAQQEAQAAFAAAQARGATIEESKAEAEKAAHQVAVAAVAAATGVAGIAIPDRGNITPIAASAPPDVIYQQILAQASAPLTPNDLYSRSLGLFSPREKGPNLINKVRHNFNARRTFKKAVEAVKAINKMSQHSDGSHSRSLPSPRDLRPSKPSESAESPILEHKQPTHLSPMAQGSGSTTGDASPRSSRDRSLSPSQGVLPKGETIKPAPDSDVEMS